MATEARRLSLADLRELITDVEEIAKGTLVYDRGGVTHLARYENKIFCEAPGAMPSPYKVSIAFEEGKTAVRSRCTCMAARSRPVCKHAAALLIAWARAPESFAVSDSAPAGMTAEKKKTVKRGKAAAADLIRAGVDQVATLVRELGIAGASAQTSDRIEQIALLGDNLRENRLRRLSGKTVELSRMLAEQEGTPDALDPLAYADLLTDMLLTVRKLEKHLGGEELEPKYVEELIGKTWRKTDRRPIEALDLVEYAYSSRTTSDDFVIRESRFVDLVSGAHYSEKQILPAFLAKRTEPKKSYGGRLLRHARGSVYPGFSPLRIDIESKGEPIPLDQDVLARLVASALPDVGSALSAFQEMRRDVFAPDELPASVRVDTVVADGSSARIMDALGHALHLPSDPWLEERVGAALRESRLSTLLGAVVLEGALPTFAPLAAVVETTRGLELKTLGGLASTAKVKVSAPDRGASRVHRLKETARRVNAPSACIALFEVREEMASHLAGGLAGLSSRATEPIAQRLRDLELAKQADLLAALSTRPDPSDRLDDFVKIYRVLEVALVRLLGTSEVDRASLERAPEYASVAIRRVEEPLPPDRVTQLRARGAMNRYEASVHYAKHYASVPPGVLTTKIHPAWDDGTASAHIAMMLASLGEDALRAARRALDKGSGRMARLTAVRVLSKIGGREAEALLEDLARQNEDHAITLRASEALALLRRARGIPMKPERRDTKDRLAYLVQSLLSASNKDARIRAARELVKLHDPAVVSALRLSFMGDVTAAVREESAFALARLGDADMADVWIRMLRDRHDDPVGARIAVRALGELSDARALDELLAAYGEGWKKQAVSASVRSMGDSAVEPLLTLLEREPELGRQKAALSILDGISDAELEGALIRRIEAVGAERDHRSARAIDLYLRIASARPQIETRVSALVLERFASASKELFGKALSRAKKAVQSTGR
jgi:hypothetical protein